MAKCVWHQVNLEPCNLKISILRGSAGQKIAGQNFYFEGKCGTENCFGSALASQKVQIFGRLHKVS